MKDQLENHFIVGTSRTGANFTIMKEMMNQYNQDFKLEEKIHLTIDKLKTITELEGFNDTDNLILLASNIKKDLQMLNLKA